MADGDAELLSEPTFLVTCAAAWEGAASVELRQALPGAEVQRLFFKGNLLLTAPGTAAEALAALAAADTQFIARIIPLHVRLDIGPGSEHLERLAEAAKLLPSPDKGLSFRVRCERRGNHDFTSREVELTLADVFVDASGPPVDLDHPRQVLTVQIFQDLAMMGLSRVEELVSRPIKRMRKYAPGRRPISRAEHKLREVLRQFDLELPAEGRALDLGAAPGGWTRVLAEGMAEVVAVDPADLDERVAELPNVTHLRCRSDELDPAQVGQFDLITNDMNMDPDRSARVMCSLAGLLRPGGVAVMTIKFVTRHRGRHVEEAVAILEEQYEDIRVRHMPHNAKETSAVMRRKATARLDRSRLRRGFGALSEA